MYRADIGFPSIMFDIISELVCEIIHSYSPEH